jgi:hypothetical protein
MSPVPPNHFVVGNQAGLDPFRDIYTQTNYKDA